MVQYECDEVCYTVGSKSLEEVSAEDGSAVRQVTEDSDQVTEDSDFFAQL